MYRAYGGWTFAFDDYYDLNITARLDDPNMPKMMAIVDPYCMFQVFFIPHKKQFYFHFICLAYIERMTMPKLVIDAGGDEFFLPDDNYYFWNDMPGPKYLRLVIYLALLSVQLSILIIA